MVSKWRKTKASKLHDEAQRLSDDDQVEKAIERYKRAIALDPSRSASHYNLGLIYKYRGDWSASFECNRIAYELDREDEASRWNLAIAATALGDWATSRHLWKEQGIDLIGDSGPIEMDFGVTPVRLNADRDGEVVWARRIDPVRARLENIPFPESGFRRGDVVLHDGAPVGERMYNGRSYPVFNCLDLLVVSTRSTYILEVKASSSELLGVLEAELDRNGIWLEDWTSTVRAICRQCSEGLPHETHDNDLGHEEWHEERRCGLSARRADNLLEIIGDTCEIASVELVRLEHHLAGSNPGTGSS